MTENPSRLTFSRRTVLRAAGAAAVAASVAGAARPAFAQAGNQDRLVTYPVPDGIPTNDSFEVKVRTPNGSWRTLDVYNVELNEIDAATGNGITHNSSVAYFDFSGEVEVMATFTNGAVEQARVRPLSYGIEPKVEDQTVRFTLTEPRKIVVEVNSEIFDCLHLLARSIETDVPDPDDPDVVYFEPGVYEGEDLAVASGQTVYLAGGAVVRHHVSFTDIENATIRGRGIVAGPDGGAIPINSSTHILVDGITVIDSANTIAESEQVTFTNFAYYSAGKWADGIDVYCSSDVLIEDVFIRSADDSIALYTHRNDYYGDTRNITIRDAALWADVAHPVNVGTHGNTADPEVLENITFSNIDILDHREPQQYYQGCFALNPGDSNLIRNVRIQDVRVEDFRWGQLIHMRVAYNPDYNTSVGRGIESVFIKNLSYQGNSTATPLLLGYDAEHDIKNVVFQNFNMNGTVIADDMQKPGWYKTWDMVPMYVNEHVTDLRFLDADTAPTDQAPTIVAADTAETTAGAPTLYTISASGYPESFGAEGLPEGLTVDDVTGVISGTVVEPGTYDVVVSAANDAGSASKSVTFTIA